MGAFWRCTRKVDSKGLYLLCWFERGRYILTRVGYNYPTYGFLDKKTAPQGGGKCDVPCTRKERLISDIHIAHNKHRLIAQFVKLSFAQISQDNDRRLNRPA